MLALPKGLVWADLLDPVFAPGYEGEDTLSHKVTRAYAAGQVTPPRDRLFRAFELCDYFQTKIFLCGQDPYFTPGAATGLAFGVYPDRPTQSSFDNMCLELVSDTGKGIYDPTLESWARQGVLLANIHLTTAPGMALAHEKWGWKWFTRAVIDCLLQSEQPVVYLLFGAPAQRWLARRDVPAHQRVINASHPSGRSACATNTPFLGSRCFGRANAWLEAHGATPIDWNAP